VNPSKLASAVEAAIDRMPSGSRKIALARTVIAVAQLTTLLFSKWDSFFVPITGMEFGPDCGGIGRIGLYCLLWPFGGSPLPTVAMILGLLVVLSGYFPRYTGILHAWLTISFAAATNLPDGGESVAQIVVLILAVILLADSRRNHWQAESLAPTYARPIAWGASHVLRLQLAWIYFNAAVSKTAVPEWQDGTAIYYITMDPMFGTAGPFAAVFDWIAYQSWGALAMAWGAILIEMTIAILLIGPAKYRFGAFWLAVVLHGLFIVMIGLWSFALVMIAAVLAATGPSVNLRQLGVIPHSERKTAVTREEKSETTSLETT
jgi:antimicrobial peptide system SdpB family protein